MRLLAEQDSKLINKKETDQRQFGMADQNLFIGMYRDTIYKNKKRVIPQEYMANARDAHREVGKDDIPIEITLPSSFNPVLTIRDFGPGIDEERSQIFSMYGASTKRENDVENGGFGIGCKCAWSYTESFTIDTVYLENGKKINRVYSLYITHQLDPGNIRVISEREVDQNVPTGTSVSIPIMDGDIDDIHESISTVAAFWDVKPRIVDDKDFEFVTAEPTFHGTKWQYFNEIDLFGVHSESFAIVDGICYKLDLDLLSSGRSRYEGDGEDIQEVKYCLSDQEIKFLSNNAIGLFFDVNDVVVAPDRENLDYNVHTIHSIKQAVAIALDQIINEIKSKILHSDFNYFESVKALSKLSLDKIELFWQDIDLIEASNRISNTNCILVDCNGKYSEYARCPWQKITDHTKTAFLVYGSSSGAKNAASRLAEHPQAIKEMNAELVVFFYNDNRYRSLKREFYNPLITHYKIKTSQYSINTHRIRGIYGTRGQQVDINDLKHTLFLKRRYNDCYLVYYNHYDRRNIKVNEKLIARLFPSHTICSITAGCEKELKRAGIKIRMADDYIDKAVAAALKLPHLKYCQLNLNYSVYSYIDDFGDMIKQWAKQQNKKSVFNAINAYQQLMKKKTDADHLTRMLLSLAKTLGIPTYYIPQRFINQAESLIKGLPFFNINVHNDHNNKIMRNIIFSYKEFNDES